MTPASFATAEPLRRGGPPLTPGRAAGWQSPPWAEPRADRLMKAVACVVFAYVWRVQDVFPILAKLQFPILAVVVAIGLFVTSPHPWRKLKQIRGPILWIPCGIFAVMLAGVTTSLWRGHSLQFALKDYLTNLVFLALVATSVRSVRDVEWYARVNLYGALFYATIVNLFFRVGADGRLGNLVYYDANDFALLMVALLPFAVYMLRRGAGARSRILGLLGLSLFLLGVVKSGSRGGFIALVGVLLYILLRYSAIRSRVRLLAAVGGLGLLVVLGSGRYWTQMSTILHPEGDYNWTAEQGRKAVWERGLGYVKERPLLGVGVGAYPVAEGTLSSVARQRAAEGRGFKWSVAHNSFLETAAELGIPGFLLFVSLLAVTTITMARIAPGRRYGPWISHRETALGQMLVGSLVGFSMAGFFVSAEYFSLLYFLLGLALGLHKVLRLQRDAGLQALASMVPPVRTMARSAEPQPAFAAPRS